MNGRDHILQQQDQAPLILPSLLLCDFGDLSGELARLEQAGVRALHLDVMDGVFVPNLSYGIPVVQGIHAHTDLPLDVHLMISQPQQYLEAFCEAGADSLTVHVEACDDRWPWSRRFGVWEWPVVWHLIRIRHFQRLREHWETVI